MSGTGEGQGRTPKALVHKKILDTAEANPDATLEEIATEVTGATTDLAERVLETYGDPGKEAPGDTGAGGPTDGAVAPTGETPEDRSADADGREPLPEHPAPDGNPEGPNPEAALNDRQTEILRLVVERPAASQGELAEALGVSRATVSRQLNAIEGFDWKQRLDHAGVLLSDPRTERQSRADGTGEVEERLARMERRLDDLERERTDEAGKRGLPVEMAHKVVHACMASEAFSTEEELALLRELLGTGAE